MGINGYYYSYYSVNVKYDYKTWDINQGKEYMISEDGIFHEINEVKDLTILDGQHAQNAQKLMKYSI